MTFVVNKMYTTSADMSTYTMYFVVGSDHKCEFGNISFVTQQSRTITIQNQCTGSNNRVLYLISVSGLPVEDQVYSYSISLSGGSTLDGSFKTYRDKQTLHIGFVSCNDNVS